MVVNDACNSGAGLLPLLFQEIKMGRGNKAFLPWRIDARAHAERGTCLSLPLSCGGSAGSVLLARCYTEPGVSWRIYPALDKRNDLQLGKVNSHNCI